MVILGHARPNNNHDDFFDPLKKVVRKFDRPVLYLHGDGHKWERKKSFRGLKNFVRIQVTQGGEAKPVKIYAPSFKAK